MRPLGKLLVLLAILLMPFGMARAHISAPHPAPMAGMPMEQCPDNAPRHKSDGSLDECTMACLAALPAADLAGPESLPITHDFVAPSRAIPLHGLHPDTATPPPKRS